MGIDLLGADPLCQGSGGRDGVLAAQSDETHFKGGHLCAGANTHGITGTGIKRRIPHLVSGKAGVVGLVQAGSTAGGNQNCLCLNGIEGFIFNSDAECALNSAVFHGKICDVYPIINRHLRQLFHCLGQNRLDVFAVDLQVSVAACDILAVLILQDNQSQLFQPRSDSVEPLRHGEEQIFPDNAVCVPFGIVHIILGNPSLCNIGVQCIDTGRQTAASLNMRLFANQNLCI